MEPERKQGWNLAYNCFVRDPLLYDSVEIWLWFEAWDFCPHQCAHLYLYTCVPISTLSVCSLLVHGLCIPARDLLFAGICLPNIHLPGYFYQLTIPQNSLPYFWPILFVFLFVAWSFQASMYHPVSRHTIHFSFEKSNFLPCSFLVLGNGRVPGNKIKLGNINE